MKKIKMYVLKTRNIAVNCIIAVLFILGFYFALAFCVPAFELNVPAAIFTVSNEVNPPSVFDIVSTVLPLGDIPSPAPDSEKKSENSYTPENISITTAPANHYTPSQGIYVQNDTSYSFDIDTLLASPLNISENPSVLLYHTHTSEAYTPSEAYSYDPSDPYRSEDPGYNMVLVGEKIASILKERGINVIHDKTCHDYPSYSGSYDRSLASIEKNLAADPSIEIILDIHRDAIMGDDGKYLKTHADTGDTPCAQALIVVGTDEGGLTHPDWTENLKLGLRLQEIINSSYPSLARPLHLRQERFNGHASKGALLIEIGSNGNTMEEALNCAERVADCIARLFDTL